MKTIFDEEARAEIINRINALTTNNEKQWGKMSLFQMLRHCIIWTEWVLGKNSYEYKQEFIGYLFGKLALKGMMKDDRPMKKGMPAGRNFEAREEHGDDIEQQKDILISLIQEYGDYSNTVFVHDFFGKMSEEQISILAYKHYDHHLRQFNG